jgi:4a-hydroxytetrahydrobiopterin dehydratase
VRQKLDNKQIEKSLSQLSLSWKLDDGFLKKTFKFKTFENAIKFINSVSIKCTEFDHHPKWTNIYNQIDVELNTHDIDGISNLDFELSEFMNITFKKIEDE